jgi:hypothetical protein
MKRNDDGHDGSICSATRLARQGVATGESRPALGEHPEDYLCYAPDGRMYALFVAGGRVVPAGDQPTDGERVELQKSMLACAGTHTIVGERSSVTSCQEQCAPRVRSGPILQT